MRTPLFACILSIACASGSKEATPPAPAATVMAGSMPSNAAPEAKPAPETAAGAKPPRADPVAASPSPSAPPSPQASGPMTAAEAAATLSRQHPGGAAEAAPATGSDEACASDDDCTLTRLAPGACCPMLCSPRAVTRKGADALEAQVKSCGLTKPCPQPPCAPPRQLIYPACEKNRCVTKVRDSRTPA